MNIRPFSIADYEDVYALWVATPGMGLNDIDDSSAGIARYLHRNPSTCFVALVSGKIVGVILSGHDGRRGYIHHTAIAAKHRKQGIGTALVEAALEALRAEGIHKVGLVVFKKNDTGNTFWQKMGFVARDDLYYRNRALSVLKRMDT